MMRWKTRMLRSGIALGILAFSPGPPAIAGQPPSAQIVKIDEYSRIRIPGSSPVRLVRVGTDLDAHFAGKFILTGTYQYGCFVGCDEPLTAKDLELRFYPDHDLAARLPTWAQYRYKASEIWIKKSGPFVRRFVVPRLRRDLLAGNRDYVSGRASIFVDNLTLGIECDTPVYSAQFVSFAPARNTRKVEPIQPMGCGG